MKALCGQVYCILAFTCSQYLRVSSSHLFHWTVWTTKISIQSNHAMPKLTESELEKWGKIRINPNHWKIDVLTQFPNHDPDPSQRESFPPMAFAKNPHKTEELELLLKIPSTKRQFKIHVNYIGPEEFDGDYVQDIRRLSWDLTFNGIELFAQIWLLGNADGCEGTLVEHFDVEGTLYPFFFDSVVG